MDICIVTKLALFYFGFPSIIRSLLCIIQERSSPQEITMSDPIIDFNVQMSVHITETYDRVSLPKETALPIYYIYI